MGTPNDEVVNSIKEMNAALTDTLESAKKEAMPEEPQNTNTDHPDGLCIDPDCPCHRAVGSMKNTMSAFLALLNQHKEEGPSVEEFIASLKDEAARTTNDLIASVDRAMTAVSKIIGILPLDAKKELIAQSDRWVNLMRKNLAEDALRVSTPSKKKHT